LIAGCLWAFIYSGMITHNFKKEIFEEKTDEQRVTVKNLVIIETRENAKDWELSADMGTYDGTTQNAVLTDIIGNFYHDNKVTVSFKAESAIFNQETKKIILNRKGLIVYADGTKIQADEFEWEGKNNNISAKGNVTIIRPNEAIITGEKALLSNQMTKFQMIGRTVTKLYGEGKILK